MKSFAASPFGDAVFVRREARWAKAEKHELRLEGDDWLNLQLAKLKRGVEWVELLHETNHH